MRILYRFVLPDREIRFKVDMDAQTGLASVETSAGFPEWAKLESHQCPHCTLDSSQQKYCPLAAAIYPTVESFADLKSYDEVVVKVAISERAYGLRTTIQRGLGSLLGLLIATSGCPHTLFLKPMARFHLPFSSEEETFYRVVSMYLMREYIQHRNTGGCAPDLSGLKKLYGNVEVVNSHVAKRLREMTADDASINALVILDFFAKSMPDIVEDDFGDLPLLFS